MTALRIGTRGSALALWQANHVREAIDNCCGVAAEIVVIKTSGDQFAAVPVEQIGVIGIFTKELEDALLDGRADLAVHSMKDVPTEISPACRVATVFKREDPRDALVSHGGERLENLPIGARIGTSSLRRASQLRQYRPDLQIIEIRGNVDTRLRKVAEGEYDAIVLAKAGIVRLGYSSRITEILSPEIVLPAVGQGALGVEFLDSREDDLAVVEKLVDTDTMWAVQAERALLKKVQGGCRLPLGAWARFEDGQMVLDACVLAADGSEGVRRRASGMVESTRDAESLGDSVADELLGAGADRLLQLAGRSVGQA
ncbi:MAG TPA: hydroxymethylbilane synthase [Candidatus Acidoferrales bacterium]